MNAHVQDCTATEFAFGMFMIDIVTTTFHEKRRRIAASLKRKLDQDPTLAKVIGEKAKVGPLHHDTSEIRPTLIVHAEQTEASGPVGSTVLRFPNRKRQVREERLAGVVYPQVPTNLLHRLRPRARRI